jgi:hypothetical protein
VYAFIQYKICTNLLSTVIRTVDVDGRMIKRSIVPSKRSGGVSSFTSLMDGCKADPPPDDEVVEGGGAMMLLPRLLRL